MALITQKDVKRLFRYNPITGLFFRKIRVSNRAKMNAPSGYINDSGYRIITIHRKKYRAHRKEKPVHLGQFKDKFEAICARKSAESKYNFHPNHGRRV